MRLIFKIACRNIMRHKGKSIIIGVIIFLGTLLMTIGNGIISGMLSGLQKNLVNNFTGDIVLISDKQESDNVFFNIGSPLLPINNFIDIRGLLESQEFIDKFIPLGKNMVMVINEEGGNYSVIDVIGADLEKYHEVFPNSMETIEGRLMSNDEKGVIISNIARFVLFDNTGIWFKPEDEILNIANLPKGRNFKLDNIIIKDSVVFMRLRKNNTSYNIKSGIKGIFKYKASNYLLSHFSLMDIESYRNCFGYFSSQNKIVPLSSEEKKLLTLEDEYLDNLFSDDSNRSLDYNTETREVISFSTSESLSKENLKINLDNAAYNLVLIRLKNERKMNTAVTKLNKKLKENKSGVRAITWKKAMGVIGNMVVIIKGTLLTFVMLLFFVAIIIIVNTLSMAALERTPEIGVMRAIGAQKNFIRSMFLAETIILSFTSGVAGMLLGMIAIKILSLLNLTSNNDILQLLFGSEKFHPLLTKSDIILVIVQLLIVTITAVIYPVKVAGSISPLDAISRD